MILETFLVIAALPFVGLGLIFYPNRLFHIAVLATFWGGSYAIFYAPRWIKKWIQEGS